MNLFKNNTSYQNICLSINILFLTSLFIGIFGILLPSLSISSIIVSILFFIVNLILFGYLNNTLIKYKDVIEEFEDVKTVSDLDDLTFKDFEITINNHQVLDDKTKAEQDNAKHLDDIADKMLQDLKDKGFLAISMTNLPISNNLLDNNTNIGNYNHMNQMSKENYDKFIQLTYLQRLYPNQGYYKMLYNDIQDNDKETWIYSNEIEFYGMLTNSINPNDYDMYENSVILNNVFINNMSKKQQIAHINSLIDVLKKKEDYEKCAKLTEILKQYQDVVDIKEINESLEENIPNEVNQLDIPNSEDLNIKPEKSDNQDIDNPDEIN
jgi:hypothetical protein